MSQDTTTAVGAAEQVPAGIDPRGPRFGAGITSALLLITFFVALITPGASTLWARWAEPAAVLTTLLIALFLLGALRGIQRHPYGLIFQRFVRPRLLPATEREDPAGPTFAQGVGATVLIVGLVLHLVGVPFALLVALAAAFLAAFLNVAFGFCLGCEMYVLLLRARLIRR